MYLNHLFNLLSHPFRKNRRLKNGRPALLYVTYNCTKKGGGNATVFPPHKNRANTLAHLLQTAYTLEGTGRQNARIFWQTDFILLPFEHEDFFEITHPEIALQTALNKLYQISGYRPPSSWWQKLKKRFTQEDTDY